MDWYDYDHVSSITSILNYNVIITVKGNDKLEHSIVPKNTMKIHENLSCQYDEHSVRSSIRAYLSSII